MAQFYFAAGEGDIAGLVCYQNQSHNFVFGKSVNAQGKPCIILDRAQGTVARLAEVEIPDDYANAPLTLKVSGDKDKYSFLVSYDKGENWTTVIENADAKNLSTQTAGGFTGVVLGMYVYHNPAPKKGALKHGTRARLKPKNTATSLPKPAIRNRR